MPSKVTKAWNRPPWVGAQTNLAWRSGAAVSNGLYFEVEYYDKDGKWINTRRFSMGWLDVFLSKYWPQLASIIIDQDDIWKWIKTEAAAYKVPVRRGKPYKGKKKPFGKPKKNEAMEEVRLRWLRERPDLFKDIKKIRLALFGGSTVAGDYSGGRKPL